jgi:tRNA-binding EMAP/Myf-like protein
MADTSQYRVGIVLSADNRGAAGQRPLKVCSVDIGSDDGAPIPVVTSAANVREGSRVVVAPVGSTIIDDDGGEIVIKKTTVGGHPSEGMFCDARMLGWGTGSAGIAAQVPESCGVGTSPPTTKPGAPPVPPSSEGQPAVAGGLFERKPTKEEKKKLAEEKRKAKKAAKGAKERETDGSRER